jgi:hypothetical protein
MSKKESREEKNESREARERKKKRVSFILKKIKSNVSSE